MLQEGIAARRQSRGIYTERVIIILDRGKSVMDEIRKIVATMEREEQRLLDQRSRAEQVSVRLTKVTIVVGIPLAFLLLGLLAVTITRGIAAPLARLSAAAEQMASGKTAVEIPVEHRQDEIGALQWSFHNMQQRMQERTAALEASNEGLRQSEERLRLMIEGVKDYAIIMLDPNGQVTSWNVGAQRIKGYHADEILMKSFIMFYTPEDIAAGKPHYELAQALTNGRYEDEGWRVRKDGSRFWASVIITPLYNADGAHIGFVKVTRDISERRQAEEQLRELNADLLRRTTELESSNKELEGFSYSVAHDLRSPLRSVDGFSKYLLEHTTDRLNAQERDYLQRMRKAAQRMGRLIDDLLNLARIGRLPMNSVSVDLSAMAEEIAGELRRREPDRDAVFEIEPGMTVLADRELLRIALQHLLENAWKFTSKREQAHIAVGVRRQDNSLEYFVQDNGVGFDMAYVDKLFQPFHRLHTEDEFSGTGIGLALVQRIIERHGGHVRAEAVEGQGATFLFSLN